MKRRLVLLSSILVLSGAVISPVMAYAEDYEAQINQNVQQIEQNNQTIQALQQEQQATAQQLTTLVKEIEDTQLQLNQLAQQMSDTQNQIITLESDITKLNEVIEKRAEKIVEQARYLQTENTSSDLLKAIFSSESIVEAFEKIWAMTELTSASNDVLKQQKVDKEKVEAKKVELDTKLQEQGQRAANMQTLASQQADRRGNLETVLSTIESQTASTQAQNADLQAKIDEAKEAQAQYLAQLEAQRQAAQQSALAARLAEEERARAEYVTSHGGTVSTNAYEASSVPSSASSSSSVTSFVSGSGNYPAPNPSFIASLNGGYPGQCTWYVFNRLAQLGSPIRHSLMGNGGEWGYYGRVNGYSVSNTPKVGTAVSWQGGEAGINTPYGHVAFVEAVYGDGSILVSEMNYIGEFIISTRVVSAAHAAQGDYIDFGL
ncbi:CHAP domain-containing protein [Carnobacteriaceae bacterium zg-ZUI240]|nr:CHAP domain-containing protein [Carnobacteriaceae bacterium zg-ZUI240]